MIAGIGPAAVCFVSGSGAVAEYTVIAGNPVCDS